MNLARALIRPYRLLLLDEPTASLDRFARRALIGRFEELKAAGLTKINTQLLAPEDESPHFQPVMATGQKT